MGRELRRVPPNWEHPKDDEGHYRDMKDRTFDDAMTDWLAEYEKWKADPEREGPPTMERFADWWGGPPRPEDHRPAFDSEPTAYQVYQNVTEGTPVSPVFETAKELRAWLLGQGHSEKAADAFIEHGYAFSMSIMDGVIKMGIDTLD